MLMDHNLEDEETQQKGVVVINNAEGASTSNFKRETAKLVLDSIQNSIPVR